MVVWIGIRCVVDTLWQISTWPRPSGNWQGIWWNHLGWCVLLPRHGNRQGIQIWHDISWEFSPHTWCIIPLCISRLYPYFYLLIPFLPKGITHLSGMIHQVLDGVGKTRKEWSSRVVSETLTWVTHVDMMQFDIYTIDVWQKHLIS